MDIKSFLSNPNRSFADGLAFYQQVKTSKEYDDFFLKAGNPLPGSLAFNILDKQLARALRKLHYQHPESLSPEGPSKQPISVKIIAAAKQPVSKVASNSMLIDLPGFVNVNDLPDEIKQAYLDNKKHFTYLAGLRQQLAACKNNEDRKSIAEQISAVNVLKETNWQRINAFTSGKESPPVADPSAPDPVQEALVADRRIRTLKINISRAEKEVNTNKLKGKKLETRLASLASWRQELDSLSALRSAD